MKKPASVFIVALLAFFSSFSYALEYRDGYFSNWHTSLQSACNQTASDYCGSNSQSGACDSINTGNNSYYVQCDPPNGAYKYYFASVRGDSCVLPDVWNSDIQACETPFDCSSLNGDTVFFESVAGCPSSISFNTCEYTSSGPQISNGDGACGGTFMGTGNVAGAEDADGDLAVSVSPGDTNCISGSTLMCYQAMDENQGYFNGELVNLSDIKTSTVQFTPDGSLLTGSVAPNPTDSNGQVIAPTGIITTIAGDTINYYRNSNNTAATSLADSVTAGNTTSMSKSLEKIAAGQCGGAGQPACKMEDNGASYTGPEQTGTFDVSGFDAEKTALLLELKTSFDTFKNSMSDTFAFSHSGGGSLPCPPAVSVTGFGEVSFCLSTYESQLSIVGTILIFVSSVLAFFIIFG